MQISIVVLETLKAGQGVPNPQLLQHGCNIKDNFYNINCQLEST